MIGLPISELAETKASITKSEHMDQELIRYWSHGPHYQFRDSIVFITWRLAFTLPHRIMELFKELSVCSSSDAPQWSLDSMKMNDVYLYNRFIEYDSALASFQNPGFSMNEPEIASIVANALHFYEGTHYELHCYCIMPNHLHLLIRATKKRSDEYHKIADIIQSIKRYTANEINKHLGKKGQVWNRFYFDRVIRDIESYERVVQYIMMNPVRANLVTKAEDWRDSYFNKGFLKRL